MAQNQNVVQVVGRRICDEVGRPNLNMPKLTKMMINLSHRKKLVERKALRIKERRDANLKKERNTCRSQTVKLIAAPKILKQRAMPIKMLIQVVQLFLKQIIKAAQIRPKRASLPMTKIKR